MTLVSEYNFKKYEYEPPKVEGAKSSLFWIGIVLGALLLVVCLGFTILCIARRKKPGPQNIKPTNPTYPPVVLPAYKDYAPPPYKDYVSLAPPPPQPDQDYEQNVQAPIDQVDEVSEKAPHYTDIEPAVVDRVEQYVEPEVAARPPYQDYGYPPVVDRVEQNVEPEVAVDQVDQAVEAPIDQVCYPKTSNCLEEKPVNELSIGYILLNNLPYIQVILLDETFRQLNTNKTVFIEISVANSKLKNMTDWFIDQDKVINIKRLKKTITITVKIDGKERKFTINPSTNISFREEIDYENCEYYPFVTNKLGCECLYSLKIPLKGEKNMYVAFKEGRDPLNIWFKSKWQRCWPTRKFNEIKSLVYADESLVKGSILGKDVIFKKMRLYV